MLVGGFEKYTISRSLVNPTDRTGQRREVDALVGFLQKHKCLGHFQKKCSSHNCHEISVPFLTIGVFFRCQYFVRPLFEIFEQEWIPWFELHVVEVYLVALSNKVAEIHVVMSCVCDSTQAVRFVTATCWLWQAVSQAGQKGVVFFCVRFLSQLLNPFDPCVWRIFGCWCLSGVFGTISVCVFMIKSDAWDVFSASTSLRSDPPDPENEVHEIWIVTNVWIEWIAHHQLQCLAKLRSI